MPGPLIRHLLHSFRGGQICARAAAHELRLSRSRFYELYAAYLRGEEPEDWKEFFDLIRVPS